MDKRSYFEPRKVHKDLPPEGTIYFKACGRCGGDLIEEVNIWPYSRDVCCLNCGHWQDAVDYHTYGFQLPVRR